MTNKESKIVEAIKRKHSKGYDAEVLVIAIDSLLDSDPVKYAELADIRAEYSITAEPVVSKSKDIKKLKKDLSDYIKVTDARLDALENGGA